MKVLLAALFAASAASACPESARILFIDCRSPATVELTFTEGTPQTVLPERSLIVTGTYSSGDRFGTEGLAIDRGRVVSRRFQGWDGLAVVSPDGVLSLHHVERVSRGDVTYNLRDDDARRSFLATAADQELSVIQSHLLITDGEIDVRDQPDQPRFARRILFQTRDGHVGLYATPSLTLFDAASLLSEEIDPVMALNLDMGAYDFCMDTRSPSPQCGWLRPEQTDILTNILTFRFEG